MKKRIWMLMLVLCLLLPVLAQAATYNVWVGGVQLTDYHKSGAGWEYDPYSNTLLLNGADIQGVDPIGYAAHEGAGIAAGNGLTIKLLGSSKVRAYSSTSIYPTAIRVSGDLKIISETDGTGVRGSLFAQAKAPAGLSFGNGCFGIRVDNGDIEIDADVTAEVQTEDVVAYAAAIWTTDDIIIDGGTVNAYLNHDGKNAVGGIVQSGAAIYTDGNYKTITINGGTVNAYTGNGQYQSCGIGTQVDSAIEIHGGVVNAYGSHAENSYGIGADGYITITGGTVTAQAGDAKAFSYGIGTNGDLKITGGTIMAVGGKAEIDSYGIGGNQDVLISNSEIKNAKGGAAKVRSFGIGATGDVNITDSSIVATGGTAGYSYGFGSQGDIEIFGANNVLEAAGGTLAVGSMGATTAPASNYRYTVNTTGNSKDNQKLNSMPNWKLYKYVKMEPGKHIEDEYIEEEISELPQTGDDSALMLWTMLLALCGTAMLLRRHREN